MSNCSTIAMTIPVVFLMRRLWHPLCTRPTCQLWFFSHWNSPQIGMLLHSNTLSSYYDSWVICLSSYSLMLCAQHRSKIHEFSVFDLPQSGIEPWSTMYLNECEVYFNPCMCFSMFVAKSWSKIPCLKY